MASTIRNVGSVDPDLRNSPVLEESEEDQVVVGQEVPDQSSCYFNGQAYRSGEFVRTGTVVLECRSGVWVEVG